MFLSRNKRNNVYPCKPPFYYIKVGFKGIKLIQVSFRDVTVPGASPADGIPKSICCGFFCVFFFRQNKAYLNLLLGMKYQSLFSLKNGPRRAKMCLEAYADSKCPDQPAHHQLLQNV